MRSPAARPRNGFFSSTNMGFLAGVHGCETTQDRPTVSGPHRPAGQRPPPTAIPDGLDKKVTFVQVIWVEQIWMNMSANER